MPDVINSNWTRTVVTILSMSIMLGISYGLIQGRMAAVELRSSENSAEIKSLSTFKTDVALIKKDISIILEKIRELKK